MMHFTTAPPALGLPGATSALAAPFMLRSMFSDLKPEITGSPLLGEHTDEVLAELGYSATEIAAMHAAKAV